MSWMPEQEPTPLRLRLGPRSEVPLRPAFEEVVDDSPLDPANDDGQPTDLALAPEEPTGLALAPEELTHTEIAPAPAPATDPLRAAASEELRRAIEQTSDRVEKWMADQRARLSLGIDAMVASLKEQRDTELFRIEEWKLGERERAERQLAEEKERFHAQLLNELVEFEHQLGERLREQEERLAKWWDEAEQLTKQRFADFGLSSGASKNPGA